METRSVTWFAMLLHDDDLSTRLTTVLGLGLLSVSLYACDSPDGDFVEPETRQQADEDGAYAPFDGDSDAALVAAPGEAATSQPKSGLFLFRHETFDGNGRTCQTCHTKSSGALSPAQVEAAWADDPDGPLFRALDSDDGTGASYNRLREDATVLVNIPLPDGWTLADDPTATTVTFQRGIPTIVNTAALDPVLMYDGRNATLQEQAHGAINAHAEPGRQPTDPELDAIAAFQQSNRFFSNKDLRKWAKGTKPAPELPPGTTDAEIRGREWMVPSVEGVCSHCHGGPMLNETTEFLLAPLPPGTRFFTAFVSEFNNAGNPVHTFEVDNGDGTTTIVETPDPGRAMITGDLADLNAFKIPSLWGAHNTAPYFHDNSAADFDELNAHYSEYFQVIGLPPLSEQDIEDIGAYLQLLQ